MKQAGSWVSLPVSSGQQWAETGQTRLVAQTGQADKKHESESDFVRECQSVRSGDGGGKD